MKPNAGTLTSWKRFFSTWCCLTHPAENTSAPELSAWLIISNTDYLEAESELLEGGAESEEHSVAVRWENSCLYRVVIDK